MTDAQKQVLSSVVRSIALFICGIAMGRGWITTEQEEILVSAAIAIAPAVWGIAHAFHSENKVTIAVQSGAAAANAGSALTFAPDKITPEMAKDIMTFHAPKE